MPIYEYACDKCQKSFDSFSSKILTKEKDQGSDCPKCGELSQRQGISKTSAPIFKGKGWTPRFHSKK